MSTLMSSVPALRYHGGKWRIAPWILAHLPPHVTYVEPYGGGASILLQKPRSTHEVYNDLSQRVVTFFRVLRERTDDLVRAIELTPYSRVEFEQARANKKSWPDDELEAARQLYILSWQGRGGPTARWNTGWRYQRSDDRGASCADDWNRVDHLWTLAARLKGVQIECDDALAVIRRYDTPATVVYADPPYLHATRSKWGSHNGAAYDHEMTDDDHRALAKVLHGIQGMAVISGYPSPLYDELYAGWQQVRCATRTDGQHTRVECLWLSPRTSAQINQLTLPIPLEAA